MEGDVEGTGGRTDRSRSGTGWRRAAPYLAAVVAVALLAVGAFALGRSSRDDVAAGPATPSSDPPATTTTPPTTAVTSPTATPTTAAPTAAPSTAPPTTAPPTAAPPTAAPAVHGFPVRPASAASYARSHHDYPAADIFAACGTDVVAVTGGVVQEVTAEDRWRPGVDDPVLRGGLSVAVVGDDGVRYYGSHLRELDPATVPGSRVAAGQRLGAVGDSGNAAGTGCHLHFGLSRPCGPGDWERRRGEIWPQPYLDAWRDGAASSPAEEIAGRPAC